MNTPVNFETSKLLKEKGFDIPVKNYYLIQEKGNYLHEGFEDSYWGDNRIVNWNKDVVGIKPFEGFLSAPTIVDVVMWLYEKHGIWTYVHKDGGWWFPVIENYYDEDDQGTIIEDLSKMTKTYFDSPTEAYEAAITYTLNNLI